MKTFKVDWTLKGSYTITDEDLELDYGNVNDVKGILEEDDPLNGDDPMVDGKLTLEVTEIPN